MTRPKFAPRLPRGGQAIVGAKPARFWGENGISPQFRPCRPLRGPSIATPPPPAPGICPAKIEGSKTKPRWPHHLPPHAELDNPLRPPPLIVSLTCISSSPAPPLSRSLGIIKLHLVLYPRSHWPRPWPLFCSSPHNIIISPKQYMMRQETTSNLPPSFSSS